jgi:hypothetical protein
MLTMLLGLLSTNVPSAQKDAAGSKDNPLIQGLQGHYVIGCNNDSDTWEADILKGKNTESVQIEG